MYAHNLPSTQVSGRPGFDHGVWFNGCPCALGFPFITTTHIGLVLSPSHVFIPLSSLRAHMHTCSPLSFWTPTWGGRVCETLGTTGNQLMFLPGQPREHSWLPNEEGYATTDMESDQLHAPASF